MQLNLIVLRLWKSIFCEQSNILPNILPKKIKYLLNIWPKKINIFPISTYQTCLDRGLELYFVKSEQLW